jgi:hypothetical protein
MAYPRLQKKAPPGDNRLVQNSTIKHAPANPFQPGAMVIVTLNNPRDKFWGAILALTVEGLSLCGAELGSFDDLIAMLKEGGPLTPNVIFFPMHRVERMELDLPDGDVPSLSQRFASRTGLEASAALMQYEAAQLQPSGDRK